MLLRLFVVLKQEKDSFITITFGTTISAIATLTLIMPYKFPDAGLTGLAVLSSYVFHISPSWLYAIGNAALLIWGWKELSPRFVVLTIYGVSLFSLLLKVLEFIPAPSLNDLFMIAVFAGVIKGIGGGLVFRSGASLGGTDIVVVALRNRYGIEVGKYSFYINLAVLLISVPIIGLERAIYGLVAIYISGIAIDGVLRSFDRRRQVFVISQKYEEVRDFVIKELGRGVTFLHGEGGFTGKSQKVIMCLLTPRQTMELKRFLAIADKSAFMVVTEASEVVGKGFKSWKEL
ncbi:MAG TPA: YitT family protein [Acetomicrobium flavidum]|nr:YitT family protein [Acetomicrobium flavidum]HPP14574.1 YitT family protein [Acetomicrobium flavidum]